MNAVPVPAGSAPSHLAQRLGYLGLAPFVLGAALVWLVRAEALPYAAQALSAYAALIVSFLGGVHWGLAMRQSVPSPRLLGWGMAPVLAGWIGVMMPAASGLVLGGVMLLAGWFVDRRLYAEQGLGAWLTLRFRLSVGAALCCFIGAAGT
ncbi:MAG: DUF3429 domain-containing protein [Burkholderiales bacterium]|nr:DUF3429 domain-containing protein [Burkholderiales bacterium]